MQGEATLDGKSAKLQQPAMTASVQTKWSLLCSKAAMSKAVKLGQDSHAAPMQQSSGKDGTLAG